MQIPNYQITCFIKKYRINSQGEAPIYLKIRIGDKKMELSTKQLVQPAHWNQKKERIVDGKDSSGKNSIIDKLRSDANQLLNSLYVSGHEISFDNIRSVLEGGKAKKEYGLIEVTTEHNNQFEQMIGTRYSYGSYKNYKTTLAYLKEFVPAEYGRREVLLKTVNHKFCERFFIWVTTQKSCKQNGAVKHIQRLKKIINYGYNMGYIQDNPIRSFPLSFKTPVREALSWEEVKQLESLKPYNTTLERVKDIVLFQVYTGLAYADVKVFNTKHLYKGLDGTTWLKMQRTKTRNTFTLPILPPAMPILHKYLNSGNGDDTPIFPVLSNQKMNYYLKIIQELAGIGKRLHTHLFRHTFASTVTLQSGIPLETVSKMMGHSKITMTQVYARVGEVKIAADMKTLVEKLEPVKK